MKRSNTTATVALATTGLLFSAAAFANNAFTEAPPQRTVEVCVAEVGESADYTAATRVRHEVESERRRTVGHTLRIDTRVYGDADGKLIREYASRCVVGVGPLPVSFHIEETGDSS